MRFAQVLSLAGLLVALSAHAGRPLMTDDAGVANRGTCQVETWAERQGPALRWVTAPACGLVLKWVPEA